METKSCFVDKPNAYNLILEATSRRADTREKKSAKIYFVTFLNVILIIIFIFKKCTKIIDNYASHQCYFTLKVKKKNISRIY